MYNNQFTMSSINLENLVYFRYPTRYTGRIMNNLAISSYNSKNITFQGGIKSFNVLNPISRYSNRYFNKSAQNSGLHITELSEDIAPFVNTIWMKSKKNTLISALDINPSGSKTYVMFLHGMAQNVYDYQPLYKTILNKKFGVFTPEYRGYGINPKAKISEDKLRADVDRAYKYLTEEKGISPENIILIGHSMGGALATNLASKHKNLKSLILICPITNLSNIGERFAIHKQIGEGIPKPIYKTTEHVKPLRWLYSLCFNSINKLNKTKVPTYIIQSKNDSVTPIIHARKLVKTARKRGIFKNFICLPTGGHKVDSKKVEAIANILENL